VHGIDAWQESINLSSSAGFGQAVFLSDELPESLPVDGPYDFVSAFSIFTHLSEAAARSALVALRTVVHEGSVLALTIRPIEYWEFALASPHLSFNSLTLDQQRSTISQLRSDHTSSGFAFVPHPSSHSGVYGDASMTVDWLRAEAKGWRLSGFD
jgi:hypothetical protein